MVALITILQPPSLNKTLFFFWLCLVACRILVPWPGIEPRPWHWKCQSVAGGLFPRFRFGLSCHNSYPTSQKMLLDHFHNNLLFLDLDYSTSFPVMSLGAGEWPLNGFTLGRATVSHNLARTFIYSTRSPRARGLCWCFWSDIKDNSIKYPKSPQIYGYFSFVSV